MISLQRHFPHFRTPQGSSPTDLPDAFCWTKMQAESGQDLQKIIRRKNLERAAGNGIFYWGVGNSLGSKPDALSLRVAAPLVVFSIMASRPKAHDVAPTAVWLWTEQWTTPWQKTPLPEHVVLLSRGTTHGGPKRNHFALVCHSNGELNLGNHGTFNPGSYRNLGSDNPTIGSSQVTAVIERVGDEPSGRDYEVNMMADWVRPFAVKLATPLLLGASAIRELETQVDTRNPSVSQWRDMARKVRALGQELPIEATPRDLFSAI